MKVPTASQTSPVIVGAAGLLGDYALRYELGHSIIARTAANRTRLLFLSAFIRVHPRPNYLPVPSGVSSC